MTASSNELKTRYGSLSPLRAAGGMGCKAPRVGHCEASGEDESEYLKAACVSAGTGNRALFAELSDRPGFPRAVRLLRQTDFLFAASGWERFPPKSAKIYRKERRIER